MYTRRATAPCARRICLCFLHRVCYYWRHISHCPVIVYGYAVGEDNLQERLFRARAVALVVIVQEECCRLFRVAHDFIKYVVRARYSNMISMPLYPSMNDVLLDAGSQHLPNPGRC